MYYMYNVLGSNSRVAVLYKVCERKEWCVNKKETGKVTCTVVRLKKGYSFNLRN